MTNAMASTTILDFMPKVYGCRFIRNEMRLVNTVLNAVYIYMIFVGHIRIYDRVYVDIRFRLNCGRSHMLNADLVKRYTFE